MTKKLIMKFIKTTWTNINIRCGKYKHLQTKEKCLIYKNIKIEFSRLEFKNWCLKNEKEILLLKRPSINRIDSNKNYSLNNIEIIELEDNIRQKKPGNSFLNGPKTKEPRGFRKMNNKYTARIKFNNKENHLGTFNTKEEAIEAFKNEYKKLYGRYPF